MKKDLFLFIFIIAGIFIFSCTKDDYTTSGNARLEFSVDTITFDTVFTTIGSTTKLFKVKNPGEDGINISNIFLAGGKNSPFRLNINGMPLNTATDISINSKDSLYIFVEVTVDPNGETLPMVINDSIIFEWNGNSHDVNLIAFGQDFHLFNGDIIQSQKWKNDKPYLIYNSVLVDTLETLTIDAGCRIYFHEGSSLFVKGTLHANGTFDEPVNFLGDRLEVDYKDIPGQWGAYTELSNGSIYVFGGLHFFVGSKDNTIDWGIIKNANKGIQIDSMGFSENPVLTLTNSRVENMSLNCLDARTTFFKASNSVFANSGSYTLALRFGGNYEFNHCTAANYYNESTRTESILVFNNYYEYDDVIYSFDLLASFYNCIIYGNSNNEISYDNTGNGTFEALFSNCLIKANTNEIGTSFINSISNEDPLFINVAENNYTIDSLSPARNIGNIEIATLFPFDLNSNSRLDDEEPDLGAFEWKPISDLK